MTDPIIVDEAEGYFDHGAWYRFRPDHTHSVSKRRPDGTLLGWMGCWHHGAYYRLCDISTAASPKYSMGFTLSLDTEVNERLIGHLIRDGDADPVIVVAWEDAP